MPQRLHRTRRRDNFTSAGAVYVGRPTIFSNPFAGRPRIGHPRSVILFAAWLRGEITPYVFERAGFSDAEIATMRRRREALVRSLPRLRARDLQCWCPLTSPWRHADVLLRAANAPIGAPR